VGQSISEPVVRAGTRECRATGWLAQLTSYSTRYLDPLSQPRTLSRGDGSWL